MGQRSEQRRRRSQGGKRTGESSVRRRPPGDPRGSHLSAMRGRTRRVIWNREEHSQPSAAVWQWGKAPPAEAHTWQTEVMFTLIMLVMN